MEMTRKKNLLLFLSINALIYIAASVYAPYITAYYQMCGLSKLEIGLMMCIGPIVSMVIQPFWGVLSDKTGQRKRILQALCLAAAFTVMLYYFGSSIALLILCALLYSSFTTALVPLSDAVITKQCRHLDINYAIIRMGGTVGYALVTIIAGFFIKENPSLMFIFTFLSYLLLLVAITLIPTPLFMMEAVDNPTTVQTGKKIFDSQEFIFIFLFAIINTVGLTMVASFLGPKLMELGFDQSLIGIMNFISAMSEVPILLIVDKLTKKFNPVTMMMGAVILTGVRLLLASSDTVTIILLSQLLQGCTYMIVFYTAVTYVSEHALAQKQSQAQSYLVMVQSGAGAVIANLVAGYLTGKVGTSAAFRMMGCSIILCSIALGLSHQKILRRRNKR